MLEDASLPVTWGFVLTTLATLVLVGWAVHAFGDRRRVLAWVGVLVVAMIVHGVLATRGFYLHVGLPPRFVLVPVPTVLALVVLLARVPVGDVGPRGMRLLVLVSVVRVAVELVLWRLHAAGLVPVGMTFEGSNFDILSGLTAPLVAWLAVRGGRVRRGLLIAWNLVALALLIAIVTQAILSLPGPTQRIAFDMPNRGVLYAPFVWLPAVIVPAVLATHLLMLRVLLRGARTPPGHAHRTARRPRSSA